jgi:hypothetical protein
MRHWKWISGVAICLGLAVSLGAPANGCSSSDECGDADEHCEGNVLVKCIVPTDEGDHRVLMRSTCPVACVRGKAGPLCALQTSPDPQCAATENAVPPDPRGACPSCDDACYCDGSTIVQCQSGYPTSRDSCTSCEPRDAGPAADADAEAGPVVIGGPVTVVCGRWQCKQP